MCIFYYIIFIRLMKKSTLNLLFWPDVIHYECMQYSFFNEMQKNACRILKERFKEIYSCIILLVYRYQPLTL